MEIKWTEGLKVKCIKAETCIFNLGSVYTVTMREHGLVLEGERGHIQLVTGLSSKFEVLDAPKEEDFHIGDVVVCTPFKNYTNGIPWNDSMLKKCGVNTTVESAVGDKVYTRRDEYSMWTWPKSAVTLVSRSADAKEEKTIRNSTDKDVVVTISGTQRVLASGESFTYKHGEAKIVDAPLPEKPVQIYPAGYLKSSLGVDLWWPAVIPHTIKPVECACCQAYYAKHQAYRAGCPECGGVTNSAKKGGK